VEDEVAGILAREDRVGLRSRGDEEGARGQLDLGLRRIAGVVRRLRGRPQRANMARVVDERLERREPLAEADPFLEGLLHLLVVERVRGAVDEALAIRDRGAAPELEQLEDARLPPFARGRVALGADRERVREELLGDGGLLLVPFVAHVARAAL